MRTKKAEELLRTCPVARLATADAQGRPHCVPVCFYWDGSHIYIALDEKPKRVDVRQLKRVRNILENPQVCVLVDRYSDDWSQLAFLQVHGRAELVDITPDVLAALRARYPPYRDMRFELMLRIEVERTVTWPQEIPRA
ncbi:MAG TPA: TIGR03668 family PPOX class F420-dependent oxidoreductase [Candidatus Xenobia bacterium]|jgi:PPOX class probable F420-dependent enzyme